jgi:hypothetical protein
MTYKWKEGSRPPRGIAVQVVGQELERIREEAGELTSAAVVDAARPKDAPLHPAFEWRDKRAAELYRQHQASTLIRAVVIVADESEAQEHRAWVSVSSEAAEKKTQYVPATVAVRNVDMFADALGRLQTKFRELDTSIRELETLAKRESPEPERLARIGMAVKALETASAALSGLH